MSLRRGALLLVAAIVLASCGAAPDTAAEASATTTTTTTAEEPTTTAPALTSTTTTTTTVPGLEVDDDGRTIAVLTGTPLPPLPATGADPAIGQIIPIAEGRGVDGSLMAVGPTGEAQAIVFLAHWCPHCRSEVAEYTDWFATAGLPEPTSMIAVTTAIDPLRQNYPPEDWLIGAGWPVPTLVDPTGDIAAAFGLTAFPFWVFVDADGAVVIRGAGRIAPDSISEALTGIAGAGTTSG